MSRARFERLVLSAWLGTAGCGQDLAPVDHADDASTNAATLGTTDAARNDSDAGGDPSPSQPDPSTGPPTGSTESMPVDHDTGDGSTARIDDGDAASAGDDASTGSDVAIEPTWPAFADVSIAAGIDAPHVANLLHAAIGHAWGDFDNDGWLDVYVTGGMAPSRLFRNLGDGTFEELDAGPAGLASGSTAGAAWGDYDNDGWTDLIVVTNGANRLFRNFLGVAFQDVTAGSGITGVAMSMMAAWGDYDNDGLLDLYIANHALDTDVLYHNTGNGTFVDITSQLPGAHQFRPAFAATFTDIDHDGDLDLYVVNDHHLKNQLYVNHGRAWSNASARLGADLAIDGMGLAVGDYDNDLDLDFYMSDIFEAHLLRSTLNDSGGAYEIVTAQAGVGFDAISWGTVFVDFDNDGWLDLYLATQNLDGAHANRLFHNAGDGTFVDVSALSGADDNGWTYGVVCADYDEDGRVDLLIGNRGDRYRLYKNLGTIGHANHWVTFDLHGAGPINRNAIGSKVWVTDTLGVRRVGEVRSGSTMGGGESMRLHFGLGAASVDRVTIRWPDGTTEELVDVPTDAVYTRVYSP